MQPARSISAAALAAALTLALPGAALAAAVQDDYDREVCCLAAEWTLPQALPAAPAAGPAAPGQLCQAPLGTLSCCVGAEWVPFGVPEPIPLAPAPAAEADAPFCCMASEWSVR
jgi:hypothetical protein